MSNGTVYTNSRGNLADLDGDTIGIAVFTSAYIPTVADASLADIIGESEAAGYARFETAEVEWDEADGRLYIAAGSQWPTFDLDGETDAAHVVHYRLGASDAARTLISEIPFASFAGEDGWIYQPEGGIARITDGTELDDRATALEARTVAGVSAVAGDYPVASVAGALSPYFENGGTASVIYADALIRSDGFDPTVGTFTSVSVVGPLGDEGNHIADVPRSTMAAADAVLAVIDTGEIWTITATGPCTAGTTPMHGQLVAIGSSPPVLMSGANGTSDETLPATSLIWTDYTAAARRLNNIATLLEDGGGAANSIIVDPGAAVYTGGAYDGLPIYRKTGFTPGDGGSITFGGYAYVDPQTGVYLTNQLNSALNGAWELFTDTAGDYGTAGDVYFVRTLIWNTTTDNDSTSPFYSPSGNVFLVSAGDNAGLWVTSGNGLQADAELVCELGATVGGGGGGSVATDAIYDAKGDLPVGTGANTSAKLTVGANDTIPVADSAEATGIKWATPSTVRTALGLVIGTNVQAYDADLGAIAGLTSAADKGIQFTGAGTATTYDLTAAGKALLDDSTAAAQRNTLGIYSAGASSTTVCTDNSTMQTIVTLALPASSRLTFYAYLPVTGNTAYDGRVDMTGPSGATVDFAVFGPQTTVNSLPGGHSQLNRLTAFSTTTAFGTNGGTGCVVEIRGEITTTSAGNLVIRGSQDVTNGGNPTTFAATCHVRAEVIA